MALDYRVSCVAMNQTEYLWRHHFKVYIGDQDAIYPELTGASSPHDQVVTDTIANDAKKYIKPTQKIISVCLHHANQYGHENMLPRSKHERKSKWYWHNHFVWPGESVGTTAIAFDSSSLEVQRLSRICVLVYPVLGQYNSKRYPNAYFSKPVDQENKRAFSLKTHESLKTSAQHSVIKTWKTTDWMNRPLTASILRVNCIYTIEPSIQPVETIGDLDQ